MATPFYEKMLDIAQKKGQQESLQMQNMLRNMEMQYLPQKYEQQAQMNQLEMQRAPLEMQEIKQRIALAPLEQQLKRAQIQAALSRNKDSSPMSDYGKLMGDYGNVVKTYGENSPQANQFRQYMDMKSAGSQGTSVQFDANGNPIVQIGGTAKGVRGGGGQQFLNPKTGEITVPLTNEAQTRVQKSILSGETLPDDMKSVIKPIAGYLGARGEARKKEDQLSSWLFGSKNDALSEYNYALSNKAQIAEQLVTQAQINPTENNFHEMEKVIEPLPGDNAYSYEKRIRKQIERLAKREQKQRETLAAGIVVGKMSGAQNMQAQSMSRLEKIQAARRARGLE